MKKIFACLLAAALFTTPAFAAGEQTPAQDPSVCAHDFELSVIREATCSEKGLLAYTCGKCGLTYTAETLPDGEHDYELTETTATCTQAGEATYVCTRCGDTYTEAAEASGHIPEDAPASCVHSQVCARCGEVLVPAAGHDYVYQYDAQQDQAGDFTAFGTWKCANCGKTLAATEGNALYYYSLPEEDRPAVAALAPASDTDLEPDSPASDTDLESPGPDAGTDAASDTDAADPRPERDKPSADPRSGLWIAVSAAVLTAVVAEAVLLVRSLRRKKDER